MSKGQKRQVKTDPKKSKQKKKKNKEEREDSRLVDLKMQHKKALKRISQIKNQIKKLEKEYKELETESYVKSRHLAKSFDKRDPSILKEYGKRLKIIQSRFREIKTTIKDLKSERDKISKT